MLNAPDAGSRDLSSLRFCYSAGEALPVELYERWMKNLAWRFATASARRRCFISTSRTGPAT